MSKIPARLERSVERDSDRFKKEFGLAVRGARLSRDWSLADLGKKTGMFPPSLCRIEQGQHPPSLRTIFLMQRVLGISAKELL